MDLQEAAAQWCGDFTTRPTVFNPCWFESVSSILLLISALIVFVTQLERLAAATSAFQTSAAKQGMTGREGGYCAACMLLMVMHGAHLVAALLTAGGPPAHIAYQAVALVAWWAVLTLAWRASRVHAQLDYRVLFPFTALMYVCSLVLYIYLYASHTAAGLPTTYLKAQIWTAALQTSLAIALSVSEIRLKRSYAPGADGEYTALPDVEAAPKKEGRTWISLFADACRWVWPTRVGMQMRVLGCLVLIVLTRFLNLAVPIVYKYMVDQLSHGSGQPLASLIWPWIAAYLALVFFQGGFGGGVTGAVSNLRQWLWIPVSQDTYRRVSLRVFEHVLDLDLSFHLKRKTGEVTKILDRGTSSIQNILSTIVFNIGPQIFDVLAAATYLASALDPWIALIVFITIGSYIPLTIFVTEWRANFRRDMNTTDNAKSARVTDALLNWETVKYFSNERYEEEQYATSIDKYQTAEYKFSASLNMLNVVQSSVMFLGVAAGLMVCAQGVSSGNFTVGDVVLFLTMMAQLYAPLNFFGTYYRIIQQYMIDMENLFELLDRSTSVQDRPGAKVLRVEKGSVEFRNVSFEYEPNAPVLRDVSFTVPGGKTIAFVGSTGSGKSTVTRLMYRFYDVKSGAILVDGQSLMDVTQTSLRSAIGMVPQDCVLFNDTILHNIRYGNLSASDEEVYAAAKAACIHDTIADKFPSGYGTVVGERGLRLSGGEKQRVAFARALLKNPSILILDEATSALDSITEKSIQAALRHSRANRTTLIVAHRLSTISDADIIAVMRDGLIAEIGKHEELLAIQGGLYAEMWSKQLHQGDGEASTSVDALVAAAPPQANDGGASSGSSTTAAALPIRRAPIPATQDASSPGGRRGGGGGGFHRR